jgi:hypothetical protein
MSYFRNIIFLFKKYKFTEHKPVLGRWNINNSEKHLNKKIYLANHDNCGPCGQIQYFKSKK